MSDNDKKKRSSTETARRIWLAGIGAYGRAFTEAQGALKDVTGKSSEVFDDLVQKGEIIEKVLSDNGRLNEIENKIAALTARLEVLEVQKQEPNKRKKKTAKTVAQRTQKLAK